MDSLKYRGVLFLWVGSLVCIILSFLIIHYKIRPTGDTLPLHYNVLVGVDLLGPGTDIYRIPLVGFGVLLVNFFIAKFVKSPSGFLSFLSALVSLIVSLCLLMSVLFLLRVT